MDCQTSKVVAAACKSVQHDHCCISGCNKKISEKSKPFCAGCADDLDGSFVSNTSDPVPMDVGVFFARLDDVESLDDLLISDETKPCRNFITCSNRLCPAFHCAEFGCARAICRVCVRSCRDEGLDETRLQNSEMFETFRCMFHCVHAGHKEAFFTTTVPSSNAKCSLGSPLAHCSNAAHRHCSDVCVNDKDHKSLFCKSCCGESNCGHCTVTHCSGEEDCEFHGVVVSCGNAFGFNKSIKKNTQDPKQFTVRFVDPSLSFKSTFVAINFVAGYLVPLLPFPVMFQLGFEPSENALKMICEIVRLTLENTNVHQLRIKFLMDSFVEEVSHIRHKETTWAVIYNMFVVYFAAKYTPITQLIIDSEYPPKYAVQEMDDVCRRPPQDSFHEVKDLHDLIMANAYSVDYKIVNQSIGTMSKGQVMISANGARHMAGMEYSVPRSSGHQFSTIRSPSTTERQTVPVTPQPLNDVIVTINTKDQFIRTFGELIQLIHKVRLSEIDESDDDFDDFDEPIEFPLSLITEKGISWDDFVTGNVFHLKSIYGSLGLR